MIGIARLRRLYASLRRKGLLHLRLVFFFGINVLCPWPRALRGTRYWEFWKLMVGFLASVCVMNKSLMSTLRFFFCGYVSDAGNHCLYCIKGLHLKGLKIYMLWPRKQCPSESTLSGTGRTKTPSSGLSLLRAGFTALFATIRRQRSSHLPTNSKFVIDCFIIYLCSWYVICREHSHYTYVVNIVFFPCLFRGHLLLVRFHYTLLVQNFCQCYLRYYMAA